LIPWRKIAKICEVESRIVITAIDVKGPINTKDLSREIFNIRWKNEECESFVQKLKEKNNSKLSYQIVWKTVTQLYKEGLLRRVEDKGRDSTYLIGKEFPNVSVNLKTVSYDSLGRDSTIPQR